MDGVVHVHVSVNPTSRQVPASARLTQATPGASVRPEASGSAITHSAPPDARAQVQGCPLCCMHPLMVRSADRNCVATQYASPACPIRFPRPQVPCTHHMRPLDTTCTGPHHLYDPDSTTATYDRYTSRGTMLSAIDRHTGSRPY